MMRYSRVATIDDVRACIGSLGTAGNAPTGLHALAPYQRAEPIRLMLHRLAQCMHAEQQWMRGLRSMPSRAELDFELNSRQVCTLIAGAINTAPMAERAGLVPFVEDGELRERWMKCIATTVCAMVMDGGMDENACDALLKQLGFHEDVALRADYLAAWQVLRIARWPETHPGRMMKEYRDACAI